MCPTRETEEQHGCLGWGPRVHVWLWSNVLNTTMPSALTDCGRVHLHGCSMGDSAEGARRLLHAGESTLLWGMHWGDPRRDSVRGALHHVPRGLFSAMVCERRIWLILPAVICFVQGLSHACLSVHGSPTVGL